MKELFASSSYGIVGLIIFVAFFVGILIWVLRPGAKAKFQDHANIPLKDEDNDR
jgi:cbb3-type cytochrome oxidase subunit 3